MIYSIMANIFWLFGCSIEVSHRFRNMTSRFDIPFYRSVMYVFFAPLTSFICCARVRHVMAFLRQWSKFETDYKICTGVNLQLKLKKNCQKTCFLIITLPVFLVLKHYFFYAKDYQVWYIPVMCYALFVRSVADFLWILSFNALAITGRSLALQLKQSIEGNNSSPDTINVLEEFRDTWIRLSNLTRQTGNVWYPVYSVGFFLYFTSLTLCLYGFLTDTGKDFNYTLDLALQSIAAFFYLYTLTATAHDASLQVTRFLTTIEINSPTVTLGGYVIVDREFLISVLSMSVTYIVVLLQVGLSL
ncbi:unnamed protein product [Timema podura]|uniref:Gustatory receptor n=1 Tax=Timema podura TaxID=61482 RepID=A0ABN7NCD0_TIMPD|nr:unnamed protein product [Timema podura]